MKKIRAALFAGWDSLTALAQNPALKSAEPSQADIKILIENLNTLEEMIRQARFLASKHVETIRFALGVETAANEYEEFSHGPCLTREELLACCDLSKLPNETALIRITRKGRSVVFDSEAILLNNAWNKVEGGAPARRTAA